MNVPDFHDAKGLLKNPKSAIDWAQMLLSLGRSGVVALTEAFAMSDEPVIAQINKMQVHDSKWRTIQQSLKVRAEVSRVMSIGELLGVDNLYSEDNEAIVNRVRRDFVNDFITPFLSQVERIPKDRLGSSAVGDALEYLEIIPETLLMGYLMEGVTVEYREEDDEMTEVIRFGANTGKLLRAIRLVDGEMATRLKDEIRNLALQSHTPISSPHPGAKIGERSRVEARNVRTIEAFSEALISEAGQLRAMYYRTETNTPSHQVKIESKSRAKSGATPDSLDIYAE